MTGAGLAGRNTLRAIRSERGKRCGSRGGGGRGGRGACGRPLFFSWRIRDSVRVWGRVRVRVRGPSRRDQGCALRGAWSEQECEVTPTDRDNRRLTDRNVEVRREHILQEHEEHGCRHRPLRPWPTAAIRAGERSRHNGEIRSGTESFVRTDETALTRVEGRVGVTAVFHRAKLRSTSHGAASTPATARAVVPPARPQPRGCACPTSSPPCRRCRSEEAREHSSSGGSWLQGRRVLKN